MTQSKFSVEETRTEHYEVIALNWIIPNFKTVYNKAKADGKKEFATEKFSVGGQDWGFILEISAKDGVGIYMEFFGTGCVSANCGGSLRFSSGTLGKRIGTEAYAPKNSNIPGANHRWGLAEWKYLSKHQGDRFLYNGELNLSLHVTVYPSPGEVNLKKDLSKDFKDALDSGVGSDVTFIFTGQGARKVIAQIPAHKTILSIRSPVFKAMFASGMKEATEDKIKVSDLSPNAMKILLRFMYTGEVAPEWRDLVGELIYGADKYQLDQLKAFLCENITSALTSVNAMKIRNLGALYNLPEVVEAAMKFMKENFEQFFEFHDIVLKGTSTSTR